MWGCLFKKINSIKVFDINRRKSCFSVPLIRSKKILKGKLLPFTDTGLNMEMWLPFFIFLFYYTFLYVTI